MPSEAAVIWFKPSGRGPGADYPCASIGKKSVDFNSQALYLMGRPAAVRIGVTADGRLAVDPAGVGEENALKLTYRGKGRSCATVNRPRLVRMLAGYGIFGRHRLEWDENLLLFVGLPVRNAV